MLIEDRDKAMRLARAIFADLTLYNRDKIAAARDPRVDLAKEIGEGRELFRTRVAPTCHEVFEEELQRWSPSAQPSTPKTSFEQDRARVVEALGGDPNPRSGRAMVLGVVFLIVAGILAAFFYRHEQRERAEHETHDKHEGARH